jgi:hypothetical protein
MWSVHAPFSDFEIARMILRRPRMCFGDVQSLREVLALIHGVAVGRYPPHGSGFLPGFGQFVSHRLKVNPVIPYITTLLNTFGDKPWDEACADVLGLLEEWKASTDQR